jgi:hypothetical protein
MMRRKNNMTNRRLKAIIRDLVNELEERSDFGEYITDLLTKEEARELDLDGYFDYEDEEEE